MSSIGSSNGISPYNPNLYKYQNDSAVINDAFGQPDVSDSELNNVVASSDELAKLEQGIDPQVTSSSNSSSNSSSSDAKLNSTPITTMIPNSYMYNPIIKNLSAGITLMGVANQTTSASLASIDPITQMSAEMNMLNSGIGVEALTQFNEVPSSTATSETDMIALGEELNSLNSGINTSNILNYSFSPTTGVSTNPYTNNNSSGSTLDIKL